MTNRAMPLTDAALRQALIELAGEPDASALVTDVVRVVDGMPQVRRRPWDAPPLGRGALLLAAVLATLGIGAAVALSQPRPDPQPTPSDSIAVPEFVVPFRYQVPDGETDVLRALRGSAWPDPSPLHGLYRGSGNLAVFLVHGMVHTCAEGVAEPSGESTPAGETLGTDPVAFLEGLRDEVGIAIGPIEPAMLGNLPAVEAEIDPSESRDCHPQAHVDGLGLGSVGFEPELRGPGKLIVARSGSATIAVVIKAVDEAAYEEWLPIAQRYVDSFEFDATDR